MQQPNIELAKTRDLGENISDTFSFIKQNFKPLFKAVLTFCGLLIIASAAAYSMQMLKVYDLQRRVFQNQGFDRFDSFFDRFGIEYALSMLFLLLNYSLMTTIVLSYMTLYKQKGNIPPTNDEIWSHIKYYILRIMGSMVLLTVLLFAATMICLFPGVYFYPIFGLIFPVIIMENASFGYAYKRSFSIIKDNWWTTFGTLFVMGIITYIGYMIFSFPTIIVTIINALTHGSQKTASSVPVTVITAVIQQLGQIIYVMPLVSLGLCYYNLTEIKEGSGLIDRINQFGTTNPDANLPAEEY